MLARVTSEESGELSRLEGGEESPGLRRPGEPLVTSPPHLLPLLVFYGATFAIGSDTDCGLPPMGSRIVNVVPAPTLVSTVRVPACPS